MAQASKGTAAWAEGRGFEPGGVAVVVVTGVFRASVCQTVDSGLYHTTEQQECAGGQSTAALCLEQLAPTFPNFMPAVFPHGKNTACVWVRISLTFCLQLIFCVCFHTMHRCFPTKTGCSGFHKVLFYFQHLSYCSLYFTTWRLRLPCYVLAASLMFHNDYSTWLLLSLD